MTTRLTDVTGYRFSQEYSQNTSKIKIYHDLCYIYVVSCDSNFIFIDWISHAIYYKQLFEIWKSISN